MSWLGFLWKFLGVEGSLIRQSPESPRRPNTKREQLKTRLFVLLVQDTRHRVASGATVQVILTPQLPKKIIPKIKTDPHHHSLAQMDGPSLGGLFPACPEPMPAVTARWIVYTPPALSTSRSTLLLVFCLPPLFSCLPSFCLLRMQPATDCEAARSRQTGVTVWGAALQTARTMCVEMVPIKTPCHGTGCASEGSKAGKA